LLVRGTQDQVEGGRRACNVRCRWGKVVDMELEMGAGPLVLNIGYLKTCRISDRPMENHHNMWSKRSMNAHDIYKGLHIEREQC